MLHLKPIFSALMRNRIAAGVIALQIALTLAIIANCAYLVFDRVSDMNRPSGLDEGNQFVIRIANLDSTTDVKAETINDMAALHAMPGVVGATAINALPLSGGGWSFSFADTLEKAQSGRDEDTQGAALYMTDEAGLEATGVRLIKGRWFRPEEIIDMTEGDMPDMPVTVITQAMAEALYGDEDPLGKPMYNGGSAEAPPSIVVGVVERLQSAWTTWDNTERSVIAPWRMLFSNRWYLIRTEPGQRDAAMGQVEKVLTGVNDQRVIYQLRSYDEIRQRGYQRQRAMAWILIATMVGLSLVTALGIVGMASFWVTQRIKQIGTRRALGARRFDVRSHFQVENGLISVVGIVLGVGLAYALNIWLVSTLGLPDLPIGYLPIMAIVVFILGQLSVLGPARRASKVSPAVATRTV